MADHFAEQAFCQKFLGEAIEMGDFRVVFTGKLIDGQKALFGVKGKVTVIVVGEVPGIAAVADDKELNKAEQGFGVAVAGIVFVVNDLLHGAAWADGERFQFDLYDGHAIDEQNHVIAVVAVLGVDAQLVDDFEGVFAPIFDVDQGVMERRAIIAVEAVASAQSLGSCEYIWRNDLLQQPSEFGVCEINLIERLKLRAEVLLQGSTVANIRAIGVFEIV